MDKRALIGLVVLLAAVGLLSLNRGDERLVSMTPGQ